MSKKIAACSKKERLFIWKLISWQEFSKMVFLARLNFDSTLTLRNLYDVIGLTRNRLCHGLPNKRHVCTQFFVTHLHFCFCFSFIGSHFYLSTYVLLLLFQVVPMDSISFPLAYVKSLALHSFKLSRLPNAQRQNVSEKKYQGHRLKSAFVTKITANSLNRQSFFSVAVSRNFQPSISQRM